MAIFTPGPIAAAISGSVGGTVFSRNRGGAYMRTRVIPTNPNTPAQQTVRALMSQLAVLWTSVLSASQREAWDAYALAVPMADPLGNPRNVGGVGMFQRSNITRMQAGLARVDDGPTVPTLASMTTPVVSGVSVATNDFDVAFENTDGWAGEDGGALLVYGSRSKSVGINYFEGPYRFSQAILGDGVTPPTSPATVVNPFILILGQRLFVRIVAVRADGRVSSPFRTQGAIAA